MHPRQHNMRALLRAIGVGDFNATQMIQTMFISPRATDPDMPPVILLTKHIQETLQGMGAQIDVTGVLDDPTADALDQVSSPEWLEDTWGNLVEDVVTAKEQGMTFPQVIMDTAAAPAPTGGLSGLVDSLPAIPGGGFTYAAGALAAFYYFVIRKKKRA